MGIEKVIALSDLLEQRELQETLEKELTDLTRYQYDYQHFQEFCAARHKPVTGEELVLYMLHSLKVQRVKKNTFNRRYFACKKMMQLEGIVLSEQDREKIGTLRKHFKSDEHAAQAAVQGKKALPSDDLLETIEKMDDVRTRAILLVQFYTGCRPSEMVLLKISDFDLEGNSVRVYLKKQKEYKEKRLKLHCVNTVKEYIRAHNLTGESHFIGTVDKHGHYRDKQISLSGYNKWLQRVIELSAYTFRKSLVSHMYKKGASVETIQKQTGHSSVRTIQEHYLDVDASMVDDFL